MRNGAAVGTFTGRAFDVDVNPLVVIRAIGKLVNSLLVDSDPVGNAELAADK